MLIRVSALGALALDRRDRRAGGDRGALLDRQLGDRARLVGCDLVLHLHRLDDAQQLTLGDRVALLDQHLPHVSLQGRGQRVRTPAARALALLALWRRPPACRRAVRGTATTTTTTGERGANDPDVEALP